jgi:hypothetical protein
VRLAAVVVLPGCGSASGPRLTLSDDACTYDGDLTASATETLEIELVNASAKLGALEIARIDEGGTFADVEEYVAPEQVTE